MKSTFIILLLFIVISTNQAQNRPGNYPVKSFSHIPKQFTNSTAEVASYINSRVNGELDKALAIYEWVTSNISYSTDSANTLNMGGNEAAKVSVAFSRRKGVCENFAAIFNDIALHCDLTSYTVKGYTKQSGSIDKTGHTWCAIRIDGQWQLFDPTWDEGKYDQFKFFMPAPQEFIQTHMPYDPLWQLSDHPITNKQFINGVYDNIQGPIFNYADSLKAYIAMDALTRYKSIAARIQKDNIDNILLRNNYGTVKMEIEMIHQDADVDHYNSAVTNLHAASAILNDFISYRNNKFMPMIPDAELSKLLSGIKEKLQEAVATLDMIDRSEALFTIGTWKIREKINALQSHAAEQINFVDRYIKTEVNLRPSLFYTFSAKAGRNTASN